MKQQTPLYDHSVKCSSPSLTFKCKHSAGKHSGSAHSTAAFTGASLLCPSTAREMGEAAPSSHLQKAPLTRPRHACFVAFPWLSTPQHLLFPLGSSYHSWPFLDQSSLRSVIYSINEHLVSATAQQHLHWVRSGKAVTSHAFCKRQWPKGTWLLHALLTGQVQELRLINFSLLTSLSNQDPPPIYFCPVCKRQENIFIIPTAGVTILFPLSVQEGVRSPPPQLTDPPPRLRSRPSGAAVVPPQDGADSATVRRRGATAKASRHSRPRSAIREHELSWNVPYLTAWGTGWFFFPLSQLWRPSSSLWEAQDFSPCALSRCRANPCISPPAELWSQKKAQRGGIKQVWCSC